MMERLVSSPEGKGKEGHPNPEFPAKTLPSGPRPRKLVSPGRRGAHRSSDRAGQSHGTDKRVGRHPRSSPDKTKQRSCGPDSDTNSEAVAEKKVVS